MFIQELQIQLSFINMLRFLLFLLFIAIGSSLNAQKKLKPTIILSAGAGIPIFLPTAEQAYGVELYTQTRNNNTQFRLGAQFDINKNNKLEFSIKRTRFKLDQDKLVEKFQNRFHDQYFYPYHTTGNQNFIYHRFAINSLEVNYGHLFDKSDMTYFLYAGVGMAYWWHYDFHYALRDKNSNYSTQYSIVLKNMFRPTYTLGFRFGSSNLPYLSLDLSVHGGVNQNEYNVYIYPDKPGEDERIEPINYRSFVNAINLALVINIADY
jgi:hypothetical protein